MAPTTFSLIELKTSVTEQSFVSTIQSLTPRERPFYVGKTHYWIHAPKLSADALTGTGSIMKKWNYLIVNKSSDTHAFTIPGALVTSVDSSWSITMEVSDEQLNSLASARKTRLAAPTPELPTGWSPSDHSGLDAADPPPDLEASLALSSYILGSRKDTDNPLGLKDFIRTFGPEHQGPVAMFNLLSFMPDQQGRYMKYIEAFQASVGIKYGGQPVFYPSGTPEWSSSKDEGAQEGGWEFCALVWYPSIYHFGKMLDDPGYHDVDRKFKQGSIRDNPLICCTEVEIEYPA